MRRSATCVALQRSPRSNGLGHPGVVLYLADSVEAHVRAGRDDEAPERLAVLERMVAQSGHPGSRGALERCRGMLAADGAFVEHLERAIELSRDAGEPFEAARAQLALGSRLRRARRRGEARASLEAARLAFEQMGSRPWQLQAEQELRAAGVGVSRATESASTRAHRAGASGRAPRCARRDEPRGGLRAVRQREDDRVPPQPRLPQARHPVRGPSSPRWPRPARSRRARPGMDRATSEASGSFVCGPTDGS